MATTQGNNEDYSNGNTVEISAYRRVPMHEYTTGMRIRYNPATGAKKIILCNG